MMRKTAPAFAVFFSIGLGMHACVLAGGNFGAYPTYGEIDSAIHRLQARYPSLVNVGSLSEKSYQGRDIFVVKISNSPSAANGRPEALISGIQHGDEPIGGYVCLNDMNYLCENYGKDAEVTWLVDNRQAYFIPVMNPDRYVWNESKTNISDRMRKTLNISAGGTEATGGVDPNRNFPAMWGYNNAGSSADPKASNYRGTAPLSEPETRAIVDFFAARKVRTWQNHHNSGDFLLVPYAYAGAKRYPPDSAVYFRMAAEQKRFYNYKKIGNAGDCYGSWIVNGGTVDWSHTDSAKYGKTYQVYCLMTEIGPNGNFYWDNWDNKAKVQRTADSIRGCDLYMLQCAGFYPVLKELRVTDTILGNKDGIFDPGETAVLTARIENKSAVDTTPGVQAILSTPFAQCAVTDSAAGFGSVKPLSEATNAADQFTVSCKSTALPGTLARFSLRVTWRMNAVDFEKTLPCSLQLGDHTGTLSTAGPAIFGGGPIAIVRHRLKDPITLYVHTIPPGTGRARSPSLEILNLYGKLVRKEYPELSAGSPAAIRISGRSMAGLRSGLYCVRVCAGDRVCATGRFVLID